MVGSRTRSQTSSPGSRKEMSDVHKERIRAGTFPLVRLKKYKVKARPCDIRLNGSIENQLRRFLKKCRGYFRDRNTCKRIRDMLVNKGTFVLVSENKLELQKQVKLTFVPSSDFEIRNITSTRVNSKKLDRNNNSFDVSKSQSVGPMVGWSNDMDYDEREAPKWSREPALSRSLRSQQGISPDTIFAKQASIRPEDLAQMFPEAPQGRDLWNSPPRVTNNKAVSFLQFLDSYLNRELGSGLDL